MRLFPISLRGGTEVCSRVQRLCNYPVLRPAVLGLGRTSPSMADLT
jgi:hypothetical protein